jgi:hypothetical protein
MNNILIITFLVIFTLILKKLIKFAGNCNRSRKSLKKLRRSMYHESRLD